MAYNKTYEFGATILTSDKKKNHGVQNINS